MTNRYKVSPQTLDHSIQQIVESIDRGYELQEYDISQDENQLDNNFKLKYNDCIVLKPYYQREYRSTLEDESSLIESILVGIPIPPVFLVSAKVKGVQVLDVVDGQHRLNAFYRYRKGHFKLKGLKLLTELEGKKFSDLDFVYQQEIVSHALAAFVFRDFPGKDFEIEIFSRYNKGTKTLTPQEIRNAVYTSPINDWLNDYVKSLYSFSEGDDEKNKLKQAYNITSDRFLKKKIHESIFAMLYIIEFGINANFKDSTTYSEEYMKEKADIFESMELEECHEKLNVITDRFNSFNKWIIYIMQSINYPFSKEFYGVSSRNYKFQMSIAMILSGIFHKYYNTDFLYCDKFLSDLSNALENSYLEDPEYNASTTNSVKMQELIDNFNYDDRREE